MFHLSIPSSQRAHCFLSRKFSLSLHSIRVGMTYPMFHLKKYVCLSLTNQISKSLIKGTIHEVRQVNEFWDT